MDTICIYWLECKDIPRYSAMNITKMTENCVCCVKNKKNNLTKRKMHSMIGQVRKRTEDSTEKDKYYVSCTAAGEQAYEEKQSGRTVPHPFGGGGG